MKNAKYFTVFHNTRTYLSSRAAEIENGDKNT